MCIILERSGSDSANLTISGHSHKALIENCENDKELRVDKIYVEYAKKNAETVNHILIIWGVIHSSY